MKLIIEIEIPEFPDGTQLKEGPGPIVAAALEGLAEKFRYFSRFLPEKTPIDFWRGTVRYTVRKRGYLPAAK